MRAQVEAIHRIVRAFLPFSWAIKVNRPYLIYGLAITVLCVTSCATISRHEFSEPTAGWQTKSGQLMYRSPKTIVIGEALVRFSKTGDFELTVSKGPGITLLSLRQDAAFAKIGGIKPFICVAEHVPEDPAITGRPHEGPMNAAWQDKLAVA